MTAGRLTEHYAFQSRQTEDDGAGNEEGEWITRFTDRAGRLFLRGGEGVIAARLESRQPVVIRVRNSRRSREITADWRVVDIRAGNDEYGQPRVVFNIRETPKETDDRLFLEFLAEAGVAT